ncbi:hypothetical protein [Jannaschia aquimarina]|nr:hypothetical protein [Jannaschia aquimarina]
MAFEIPNRGKRAAERRLRDTWPKLSDHGDTYDRRTSAAEILPMT